MKMSCERLRRLKRAHVVASILYAATLSRLWIEGTRRGRGRSLNATKLLEIKSHRKYNFEFRQEGKGMPASMQWLGVPDQIHDY